MRGKQAEEIGEPLKMLTEMHSSRLLREVSWAGLFSWNTWTPGASWSHLTSLGPVSRSLNGRDDPDL